MDFWIDFGVILDVLFFGSIFGCVIFALRERGAASALLQRDFSAGAYGPDAPLGGALTTP